MNCPYNHRVEPQNSKGPGFPEPSLRLAKVFYT
jgi:hypothetical protein